VTDTTAYLPDELIAEHGIHRVSLYVIFEGEQRPEIEIASEEYGEFFERLRKSEEGAKTSQPSVGDFVSVYEPLLAEGREIVSVHLSAGISGTCESAGQARDRLIDEGKGGERIRVYDSRSAAGGQGMVVLAAAKAAARGADGEEVVVAADRARASLKMWFAIDTLEYLRKGGRIGGASAWIGSALKIKPIMSLESQITPVERVRTAGRAFEHCPVGWPKAEARIQEGRVAGVQQPAIIGARPVVDHRVHYSPAEAAAAMMLQHKHVDKVGERDTVGHGSREPDL